MRLSSAQHSFTESRADHTECLLGNGQLRDMVVIHLRNLKPQRASYVVTPVFSFKLITVVDFYRPHVCVPSKFLLKPNAECDGTGRWG